MKLFKKSTDAENQAPKKKVIRNKALFKRGGYAIAITAVAIAATILINVLMGALSERFNLSVDISFNKDNSISEENVEYIKSVTKPITVTLLATKDGYSEYMNEYAVSYYSAMDQNGEYYDQTIRLIEQYAAFNDNIKISYVDIQSPEGSSIKSKYPGDALVYGDILVESSFKAESGSDINRHKVISFSDIYALEDTSGMAAYGMGYYSVSGSSLESRLTSAIASVTAEEVKKIAFLADHSNADAFAFLKENLELNNFEIVTVEGVINAIPEGVDGVMVVAPKSDFLGSELDVISEYLDNDGKLGGSFMYFASTESPALPNLNEFLQEWGIKQDKGILREYNVNMLISQVDLSTFRITPTENEVFNLNQYLACGNNVPFKQVNTIDKLRTLSVLAQTSAYSVVAPLDAPNNWEPADDAEVGPYPSILMSTHTDYVGEEEESSYVVAFSSVDMIKEDWTKRGYGNLNAVIETANYATGMTDHSMTFIQKVIESENYSSKVTQAGTNAINIIFMITLPVLCLVMCVVVFIRRKNR